MRLTAEGAATRLEGPLLFLRRTLDVGLHDAVEVRGADGRARLGRVAAIDHDVMTIEVLESTSGLALADTVVRFFGEPLSFGLSPAILGRVFNGVGQVIDGGPPIAGARELSDRRAADQSGRPRRSARLHRDRHHDARPHEQPRARPEAAAVLRRRAAARPARGRDRRPCAAAPRQGRRFRHRVRRHRRAVRQRRVLPPQPRAGRRAGAHGAVPQPRVATRRRSGCSRRASR